MSVNPKKESVNAMEAQLVYPSPATHAQDATGAAGSVFLLNVAGLSISNKRIKEQRKGDEDVGSEESKNCHGRSCTCPDTDEAVEKGSSSSSSGGSYPTTTTSSSFIMKTPLKATSSACHGEGEGEGVHPTCSVCWSPMNAKFIGNMSTPVNSSSSSSSGSSGAATCTCVGDTENAENNIENSHANTKKPASVTKTRCGHYFHKRCLLETKLRKPECPMCRAPITPITNPTAVTSGLLMQSEELFASSMRDAVIHASHRGRNAVRAAMQRREEQERVEAASAAAAQSQSQGQSQGQSQVQVQLSGQ